MVCAGIGICPGRQQSGDNAGGVRQMQRRVTVPVPCRDIRTCRDQRAHHHFIVIHRRPMQRREFGHLPRAPLMIYPLQSELSDWSDYRY